MHDLLVATSVSLAFFVEPDGGCAAEAARLRGFDLFALVTVVMDKCSYHQGDIFCDGACLPFVVTEGTFD